MIQKLQFIFEKVEFEELSRNLKRGLHTRNQYADSA